MTLTANAEGPEIAEAMRAAFAVGGPFLASPLTIAAEDGYLTIRFPGVSDDPAGGPTSVGAATPGAEIVGALAGFSHQHSLAVCVVKALLTFSAIREGAGLPPARGAGGFDVVPSVPLSQDRLSPQLSDGIPDASRPSVGRGTPPADGAVAGFRPCPRPSSAASSRSATRRPRGWRTRTPEAATAAGRTASPSASPSASPR